MQFLRRLKLRLEFFLDREKFDREMREEMALHVDLATDALRAKGGDVTHAQSSATRKFGSATRLLEDARSVFTFAWLESLMQDVRYAARSLRRAPVFSAVSVLSLAIGIGATTALFTLVNAALFKPLPLPEPDRLMLVSQTASPGVFFKIDTMPTSFEKAAMIRTLVPAFERVGAFSQLDMIVSLENQSSVRVAAEIVDVFYLPTLGVSPELGRWFANDDDVEGAASVVILGHALWQRDFGADPEVVGKRTRVNGAPVTVVGVMPDGFHGLSWEKAELWMPKYAAAGTLRGRIGAQTVARLRPDAKLSVAAAQLTVAGRALREKFPPRFPPRLLTATFGMSAVPLAEARRHPLIRPMLLLFSLATVTVLLVVCANLGSLLVARGRARAGEFGVRLALGAGRRRLIRQLCTEVALLACIGGVSGLALATGTLSAIERWHPSLPPAFIMLRNTDLLATESLRPDARVIGFGFALALLVTAVCGIIPAIGVTRSDLIARLRQQAMRGSARHARGRRVLVAVEVMMATALLVSAGLMVQSVQRMLRVDTGFVANQAVMLETQGIRSRAPADSTIAARQALLDALSRVPGLLSVSNTKCAPFSGGCMMGGTHVMASSQISSDDEQLIEFHAVDAAYFATLRIPLVEGRLAELPRVSPDERRIVVNETAARRYWPGKSAIGQQLRMSSDSLPFTIIAVAHDVKYGSIDTPSAPALYAFDGSDASSANIVLIARTDRSLAAVLPAIRRVLAEHDPGRAIVHANTLDDVERSAMSSTRFITALLISFGAIAAFLAALGVYGVLAYMVAQRTREFGIRMALGASVSSVRTLVVRQGLALVVGGVIAGAGIAYAASVAIEQFLFGVGRTDPTAYLLATGIVLIVGTAAAAFPARRATKIEPVVALRAE